MDIVTRLRGLTYQEEWLEEAATEIEHLREKLTMDNAARKEAGETYNALVKARDEINQMTETIERLTEALVTQTLDDERRRLRAALKEIISRSDGGPLSTIAKEALNEQTTVTTRRILSDNDSFCPSCGHNRDKSSISSIDHGEFKSCQKCGITWEELNIGGK